VAIRDDSYHCFIFNASTGSIAPLSRQTLSTHPHRGCVRPHLPTVTEARSQSARRSRRAVRDDGCASVVLVVRWSVVDLAGRLRRRHAGKGSGLNGGERFMSPPGDWELNWGVTRPFCQLHCGYGICIDALHCYKPLEHVPETSWPFVFTSDSTTNNR